MTTYKKRYSFIDILYVSFRCNFAHSTALIILTVLNGIVPILQIMVTTKIINTAIIIAEKKEDIWQVYLPIVYMILLIGYQWISEEISRFSKIKLSLEIGSYFRKIVTYKIAKLSYNHIENNDTWDLINRVLKKLEEQMTNAFINMLSLASLIINVAGILWVIFVYAWWAVLLIIGLLIPLCYLSSKGAQNTYAAERDISELVRKYEYFGEVLTGRAEAEERTLFGFTKKLNDEFKENYDIAYKIRIKIRRKWFFKMKAGSFVTSFALVLIIFAFLKPVLTGKITSGFFISIVKAVFSLIQKMSWSLTGSIDKLATYNEYLKDLNSLLSLEETEGAIDEPTRATWRFKSLEFNNVYFKYPGTEQYILSGMSFKIEGNKHYAFVGVNGAGKTTIIKLISGLYDDYEGEILINGKNLTELSKGQLKSIVSVLFQDFAKYNITVKENIIIGNINEMQNKYIDEKLIKIIDSIGLTKVVRDLPEGMDTPLGKTKENGQDLSGGQWQRVAIARALINPAPLRILDEPTAALDPISESELYEDFNNITKGSTTILISHRLGSTKLADEIFVIGKGKLIEKGTHEELMKRKDIYSVMYNNQKEWYKV